MLRYRVWWDRVNKGILSVVTQLILSEEKGLEVSKYSYIFKKSEYCARGLCYSRIARDY